MKKAVLFGLLAIAIIAGAGVYFLVSNLDGLVAQAIEENGGAVTDTRVEVSGVEIELREGRSTISGLKVGSPAGFSTANVFELGDITVDLDLASVRKDPIVLNEVRISAPVVHAELNDAGELNLDELRKRVQSYGGQSQSANDGAGPAGAQKRIRIMDFVFEGGQVNVDASAIGVEERRLELPEIRLSDVGGSQGAPPDEIAKIILSTFAKEAASVIARSEIKGLIDDQLGESLGDKAKDLLEGLSN